MEEKKTKSIISLVLAAIAVILLIVALIPLEPIKGTQVNFYGPANVACAVIALPVAIAAIVLGVMGKKHGGKGMAITGIVFGILSLIASIGISATVGVMSLITDYANNGDNSFIAQSMSKEDRKQFDDIVSELKKGLNGEEMDVSKLDEAAKKLESNNKSESSK